MKGLDVIVRLGKPRGTKLEYLENGGSGGRPQTPHIQPVPPCLEPVSGVATR